MKVVKPRRRDISAALTRTAVLNAARDLFIAKGFEATSIDEIARASESSNGAVYHHFRDKQEIFAELFQDSQAAVLQTAIAAMPSEASAWERVELATRAFLRSYVLDADARALLAQAISVLGWDRVRQLDEKQSLPMIRATLTHAIETGESKPVPVTATADILFSVYCNAVLFVAASENPDQAARDAETVIATLLSGMRAAPS
ncbi:TetR/AcrR family transcriptional regulator [Mycobacterium sp. D16R24]|uniref:TetR/AcrR family transcriptional regulator n=1 Tax=Mycobacterium sp. D16R24 TaxID=1855656 RepID=UPI001591EC0F|nr:TetR/AcrR family transcriptional regulator [Mycobacterium sp. D16R24]